MYDWRKILESHIIIVPIGNVDHPYYGQQETLQMIEIATRILQRENIMLRYLSEVLAALSSWVLRHKDELQFCDVAGLDVVLENLVIV
jgi:hypothetical protein